MLYLDASAFVKRYIKEPESSVVRKAMAETAEWAMCRIGAVETLRVVGMEAGKRGTEHVRAELGSVQLIEIDAELADRAVEVAVDECLRTLDALHLAAALILPRERLTFATWDRRLHAAARRRGLATLPEALA